MNRTEQAERKERATAELILGEFRGKGIGWCNCGTNDEHTPRCNATRGRVGAVAMARHDRRVEEEEQQESFSRGNRDRKRRERAARENGELLARAAAMKKARRG